MNDDCIFCKIIKGEIPSFTIYEDEYFKAFLDRFPSGEGHVVIVSKKHFKNVFELDDEYASRALIVVKNVVEKVDKYLHADGYNVLQNNEEAAGQSVFHYHIHVIPRFKNDKISIKWEQLDLPIEELEKTHNNIINA